MSDGKAVSAYYMMGIIEGRRNLRRYGMSIAVEEIESLKRTARKFEPTNPVGQMLRGERDFWLNQVRAAA